nr:carboxylesterase family protein [Streptomyces verrucosisporus]
MRTTAKRVDPGGFPPTRSHRPRRSTVVRSAFAALSAVLVALILTPTAAASPPTVTVSQGRLEGVQRQGVAEFHGIRYAAPPTGPLRWRPPQPASPWSGTLRATTPGPRCPEIPQPVSVPGSPPGSTDEDCLFLNVYTPTVRAADLPVMVWIHGGYFIAGSGEDYDAEVLAGKATSSW